MYSRLQHFIGSEGESLFLWGARQTGKSTLLKGAFSNAQVYDLLLSEVYDRLLRNPEIIRQNCLAQPHVKLVIIDEIQRLPQLLNEIHWLLVNTDVRFVLTGSSPRKIVRTETNLLGGRALTYYLLPLTSREIPDFDLIRALNHGLLPRHYISANPTKLHAAYVGNYLRDEIIQEARIRNINAFNDFLRSASFSNGEMVNYSSIAAECGVSSNTVKEYFHLLEETLLGNFVPAFQKKAKRRIIHAPKFYFFDLCIVNHLMGRKNIRSGTEQFGAAFEHFIFMEIRAHCLYSGLDYPINYWRTTSGFEVDFILNNEIAIEVKSSDKINDRHLKGLKAFHEEFNPKHSLLVCNEPLPRQIGAILVLPWQLFLDRLWGGDFIE